MGLVPSIDIYIDEELEITRESDEVHHILNENRLSDNTLTELDAVKQSVFCILATEQAAHPIYDDNFGIKTLDLIGKDYSYTASELMRRIKEALLLDDRIKEIKNLKPAERKDGVLIEFEVVSVYGNFKSKITKKMIGDVNGF